MSTDTHAYVVTRREVGTAYPRNGNLDNATKRYRWDVRLNGRLIGIVNRRAHADDLIEIHKADPS